jgi:hypothetical protein
MPSHPYEPRPIDTSGVTLPHDVESLIDRLARNVHETWAEHRMRDGWRFGPRRSDAKKEHPSLVPYDALDADEQAYDLSVARGLVSAMIALGYRIERR